MIATATGAITVPSCSNPSKPTGDLVVTSFSPGEQPASADAPVQIQFDRPVVEDREVGAPLSVAPVAIEPSVAVTAHWLDRQTLVLTPREPLKASTKYKVALTGVLGERTGGFSFSFVHAPLVIEGVFGVDTSRLSVKSKLPVHFNQAVRPEDVIAHCRIKDVAGGEPVALVLAAQKPADKPAPAQATGADREPGQEAGSAQGAGKKDDEFVVEVEPAKPLAPGKDYQLVCDKLVGSGGNSPIAVPYVLDLRTHDLFFVKAIQPEGWSVHTDEVEIALTFSTPVDLDAVRASLRAKPKITGLDAGWLDHTGTIYKTTVELATTTEYELSLDKKLVDTHGQKISQPFQHTFRTGDARPTLTMETGIYAVEPASEGYPVWTRNVRDFDVRCAAVPRERVVRLLTSDLDYDPWYDAGTTKPIDWKQLGLKQAQKRIGIAEVKNKWHLDYLSLSQMCGGKNKLGLYLAEVQSRDIQLNEEEPWRYRPFRRVLANVTDLGVLLKAGPASGIVWVSSISTGKPVAGARVTLYSPQGKQVHRGQTDASGILRLPGTTQLIAQPEEIEDEFSSYRSQRMIALVEHQDELAVVDGNWSNGIQIWNFGIDEDRSGGKTRIRGFIQSDRGIYRPGETVHFKGLVRELAENRAPAVPQERRIQVTVEDSRGQGVFDKKLDISQFGGFSFSLPLTAEANLGDYHVSATIQGQTFRERFMVEEFRPVSFEVKLDGSERHNRLGDKLRFDVKADYLFGAPVAGAKVEWYVQRRPHHVTFPSYSDYGFQDFAARGYEYYFYDEEYDSYTSFVADGEGKTDGRGQFRISLRDPEIKPKSGIQGPQDYLVGVTIHDETDQTVSARSVITAHQTDFYLGLHTQEYVQAVDMPFAVNTVALSPTGERVATKATLRFVRESYHCEYSGSYRVSRECTPRHEVAVEREIDIPKAGTSTERILPKKPGEYIVRLEAKDSRGNTVTSSGYVWVIGKGEAFWSGDESDRMGLVASKTRYEPGETARLVPRTDMQNATALVTIERNGILDAFVKPMKSSSDGIEIKLTDAHAPNVFASVAMVAGRTGKGDRNRPQFKLGVTELAVSAEKNRLAVEVSTERPSYQPGEQVSGVIRVTSAGTPVRAEVSVSAADEGVLQLIAYKTPNPMDSFYKSWGLGVDSATNWNRIARLNAPADATDEEGGDSGGAEGKVRSNFVSSAYWEPSLVTDERGEIRFTFKAPDNLTAFRIMAVAADAGSRFGAGEQRFTVSKPLLAKPVLPRFLNTGDEAQVGVVIHNYTDQAGTAAVTASAKGVRLKSGEQQVALQPNGSARVRFPIRVGTAEAATFEFSVRMGKNSDALRMTVPIQHPLRIDRSTLASGVLGEQGQGAMKLPVTWGSDLVANQSSVTVTIDRTGLAELEPGLRYLVQYPYGCLEQTLSRFIPLTKVEDLARSLDIDDLRGPKLKSFIRAGVAKVVRHQHDDGHFSLWPSGSTYPHLTVYALYGLSEAKRAGVAVPADSIQRGLQAVKTWVSKQKVTPTGDSATMAMAAYVLAELGQPDRGLNARLYQGRRGLPRYGLAFLLRAMKRASSSQADLDAAKADLVAAATVDGDTAIVREPSSRELYHYMSSDVRSSAMVLSALLEVDPQNPLVDKLAAGLKKNQRPGGGWFNTQENVYSLVALADYARRESKGSAQVTVTLGGKRLVRKRLNGSEVTVLHRSIQGLKPGELVIETQGKVRYAVRLTEAREDLGKVAEDRGFEVKREYLDPKTNTALTKIKAGELVKVRLTMASKQERRYVAIDDPLPAGFEAVNLRLATSEQPTPGTQVKSSWSWTHTELRDDRVLGFMDLMRPGTVTLEYLARATIPGTFTAPPARAEEMYTPENYGRTPAVQVAIK